MDAWRLKCRDNESSPPPAGPTDPTAGRDPAAITLPTAGGQPGGSGRGDEEDDAVAGSSGTTNAAAGNRAGRPRVGRLLDPGGPGPGELRRRSSIWLSLHDPPGESAMSL
jgi:hypothetical protein